MVGIMFVSIEYNNNDHECCFIYSSVWALRVGYLINLQIFIDLINLLHDTVIIKHNKYNASLKYITICLLINCLIILSLIHYMNKYEYGSYSILTLLFLWFLMTQYKYPPLSFSFHYLGAIFASFGMHCYIMYFFANFDNLNITLSHVCLFLIDLFRAIRMNQFDIIEDKLHQRRTISLLLDKYDLQTSFDRLEIIILVSLMLILICSEDNYILMINVCIHCIVILVLNPVKHKNKPMLFVGSFCQLICIVIKSVVVL